MSEKAVILTIPNDAKVSRIEYKPKFSCICSIGNSPFWGDIKIIYTPKKVLLEFESFEKWLRDISTEEMTIEGLTRLVYDILGNTLSVKPDEVTVEANTLVHGFVKSSIYRGINE